MGIDDNERDRSQTCVRVTVSIEPMSDVDDALVGLVSCFAFDLSQTVECPQRIGAQASILVVEEMLNVLERSVHSTGELKAHMTLTDDDAQVQCVVRPSAHVASPTPVDWFPPDEPGATRENPAMKTMSRKRSELEKAIKQRLVDHSKGGLGLVRLEAERKKRDGGGSSNDGGSSGLATVVALVPKKPQ